MSANSKEELRILRNGTRNNNVVNGLDKPLQPKPLGEQSKAVRRQELMVVLMNLGIFACGIGLGLPSVTLTQLTDPNEMVYLDKSQASWFASISSITSPLGALMAALLMDRIGRKKVVIIVNLFAIASWALMALALQEHSHSVYIQLLISRCIIGITMGMGSSPSGLYGAEISVAKIRGRLILGVSISVASGILLVYVLGYFIRTDWHMLAMILLAYQVTCLALLIPVIETPSWLMSKGRAKEAKASLYYFRGLDAAGHSHPEVESEFAVLLKSIQLKTGEKKTPFYKAVCQPEVYKPLLIMIGLFCCQQFSGIFVVVVYAVQIAIEAGVNIDPILCAVFIGIARTTVTALMGGVLEKYGRRQAGMFSAGGMAICMFALAATTWFPWLHVPYLPAALIVIYIITSTLGIFTLPFFMNSEVFPQKVRGPCAGLTGSFGFLMSFIVLKAYPSMRDFMGAENVFALYGVMSVLSIAFVYFCLPETKGKTLLEIEEYFRYGKFGIPTPEIELKGVLVNGNGKTYTIMRDNQTELETLRQNGNVKPTIVCGSKQPVQYKPLGEQPKAVRRQERMIFLLIIGMLAFGMGLALPAVTLDQLTDPKERIHLDKSEASWFASISTITCPLGSLLTAFVMDKIGRKRTFIVFNCIAIVSWAFMALAVQENPETVFIQLMLSRCLIGVAMGMGSSPPGVYAAEISLPKIRSRLILGTSLAIASGVLAIYVLGYFIRGDWHLLAMVLFGFQVVCVLLLIPVIDTPSSLLARGKPSDAKAALSYFRGLDAHETHEEVDAEFDLLVKSNSSGQNEKKIPFRKSLRLPEVYKPLLIICGLFFCQQFAGIYVVVVYAVQIASESGSTVDPILCAVFIGVARVLTTCVLGFILEKMGRRQAAMISALGMSISMFLLSTSKNFPIPYFSATVMIIYIVFSALGLWTLPFFIASEVFPQKVRGACSGVIGFFAYVMAFLVLKAHPFLVDWMEYNNVLRLYAGIAMFSVFYVYVFLPETKGKTLQEIEEYFRKSKGKKEVQNVEILEVELQESFIKTKA
ncbi:uncharacterized protein LOC129949001 [Eupeodes corollae]|uniref:uncharacterized protein LOC129949001 n=1 Tax=Eupeodes corollae TaxID=290404 RepID=UPI0024910585|nr:uncharacterized protein LOC129949001 [Eupeodes corollae]